MARLFSSLVDLREGEGVPVLKASVALFGVIAGHSIMETARDALFLEKLPARRLPIVYLILAALAFVVSGLSAALVQRFGRRNALILTLLISAYGTTILYFAPRTAGVVFAIYVWSGLIGTVLATQFWIFAGQVFTVTQGKRLFGVIGAGGVAGAVAGAATAAGLVSVISVGSLMLVAAGLFVVTGATLTGLSADERRPAMPPREETDKRTGLALFREFPYLRLIALSLALATAAALCTDYLFKLIAASHVPPEKLGVFFGRTYAVLNAAALVVQLGLAGFLIRRIGVVPSLLVLPLGLLAGGAGVILFGAALVPALLTKGVEGSMRHSLHRVASELAWMPLPASAREGSKELLETVFGRGVQALVAGGLLALAVLHVGTPRVIAGILAALAAAWLVTVLAMRRPYIDLFRQALSRGSLEAGAADELNLGSMEALLEALSSREPARVIAAMDLLAERRRTKLIPGLVLYHEAEPVLLRALELIARSARSDWPPLAERLLSHASEAVRIAAVRALSGAGATSALERALSDPCDAVRSHAAFSLVHAELTQDPMLDPRIAAIATMSDERGRTARIALLDAIYDRPSARWADVVLAFAKGNDVATLDRSTLAMGRIRDERFIPILIGRLAVRDGRGAVRDALVFQGEKALAALTAALAAPATDDRVRLHIPRTISRFKSQKAVEILTDELCSRRHPGTLRYKALRGLVRLATDTKKLRFDRARIEVEIHRNLIEHLRMLSFRAALVGPGKAHAKAHGSGRLILGLIDDKRDQALDRAFRLLQILHPGEDIRSVELALRSQDTREQASAIEFLEALTFTADGPLAPPNRTHELFRLVVDDLPDDERLARAAADLEDRPTTHEEALIMLLREKDTTVAAFAAYHALTLRSEVLRMAVREASTERPSLGEAAPLTLRGSRDPEAPMAWDAAVVSPEVGHGG